MSAIKQLDIPIPPLVGRAAMIMAVDSDDNSVGSSDLDELKGLSDGLVGDPAGLVDEQFDDDWWNHLESASFPALDVSLASLTYFSRALSDCTQVSDSFRPAIAVATAG
jgi:hypothetical protein